MAFFKKWMFIPRTPKQKIVEEISLSPIIIGAAKGEKKSLDNGVKRLKHSMLSGM